MKSEIVTIGDEILIGQINNTNSSWMAQQLNSIGIRVNQITSIADNKEQIINTLEEAGNRADIILITGGLGPTKDDITKQTLCEFFNTDLVFNQEAYQEIVSRFASFNLKVTDINKQQAYLPACCMPVQNSRGTAPGMWFEKDGKIYVSMPGVPYEMQTMITNEILPRLSEKFKLQAIYHKTVLTQGMGESWLSEKIASWEDNLPENVKLAYLPQPGLVRLRLSASGEETEKLQKQVEQEIEKLLLIIPDLVFGYNDDTLEGLVGIMLKEREKTLATAESCTGGYIAHLITSIPGSSDYYVGSVVSYANEIKQKELGVKEETLIKYGAVSEAVVIQMAEGIKEKFSSDYAIGISGVAGPDGGIDEKPVGTVWIAIATPAMTFAKKFRVGRERGRNIRVSALTALNMLRKVMLEEKLKLYTDTQIPNSKSQITKDK